MLGAFAKQFPRSDHKPRSFCPSVRIEQRDLHQRDFGSFTYAILTKNSREILVSVKIGQKQGASHEDRPAVMDNVLPRLVYITETEERVDF